MRCHTTALGLSRQMPDDGKPEQSFQSRSLDEEINSVRHLLLSQRATVTANPALVTHTSSAEGRQHPRRGWALSGLTWPRGKEPASSLPGHGRAHSQDSILAHVQGHTWACGRRSQDHEEHGVLTYLRWARPKWLRAQGHNLTTKDGQGDIFSMAAYFTRSSRIPASTQDPANIMGVGGDFPDGLNMDTTHIFRTLKGMASPSEGLPILRSCNTSAS